MKPWIAAALALACFSPAIARANSIEIGGVSVTYSAGVYDYAYTVYLTVGNSISSTNPGGPSLFTFYDVTDLTGPLATFSPGATFAADWSINIQPTTANWSAGFSTLSSQGGSAVVPDNPLAPNVNLQYINPANLSATGSNVTLGVVNIFSTQSPDGLIQYSARWVDNGSGLTEINTDTPIGPHAIPVPPALWTGLSVLAALGLAARFKRRRSHG